MTDQNLKNSCQSDILREFKRYTTGYSLAIKLVEGRPAKTLC